MASNPGSSMIDWGQLYDMYAQAEEEQRASNQLRQSEKDKADKSLIDDIFRQMENDVYSKVDKGERGDFSTTEGFDELMKRRSQANTKLAGTAWDSLLVNPEQSERYEGQRNPWDQVANRLTRAQENANFQADFKKEQAEWRKYQEDLAAWNKANQQPSGQQWQTEAERQAAAARGINNTAQARGGAGQSWFFTPEGQAYLNGQAQKPPAQSWQPTTPKPTYTGNFGTSGSVAGKRNRDDEDPLF